MRRVPSRLYLEFLLGRPTRTRITTERFLFLQRRSKRVSCMSRRRVKRTAISRSEFPRRRKKMGRDRRDRSGIQRRRRSSRRRAQLDWKNISTVTRDSGNNVTRCLLNSVIVHTRKKARSLARPAASVIDDVARRDASPRVVRFLK